MLNIIQKISKNFVGKNKNKKQIILTHSSRDAKEYLASLDFRRNGNLKRVPHYFVKKDGEIIQLLEDNKYSAFIPSTTVSKNSIIICLENLGWLDKVPLKSYHINWIGSIYSGKTYERKWRDYFIWDTYTEEQIKSTAELCKFLINEHGIKNNCVGHNTKVDKVELFNGIVSRSNYNTSFTDVSPAFDFETFKKYLKEDEQLV